MEAPRPWPPNAANLERAHAELALRTAELRALVDNIGDFIVRFDRELRHLFVNRAFLEATGLCSAEIIGRTNEELGMPADLCRFWRERQTRVFETGHEETFEFEFRMPDGIAHCFHAKVAPELNRDGKVETIVSIVRDISLRKQAEEETRELRRELAHTTRVAALGALTSSLAHELNQPLTAILANAQAGLRLLGGAAPDLPEVRAILTDIVADDRRASGIIDRVRRMLVKGAPDSRPLELNALMHEVATLLRGAALIDNAAISFALAADLPSVSGDRIQLQQVILNLMLNALEAMKEPPARERRVTLRTRRVDERTVAAEVEDTGSGIPSGDLERIFEPFFTSKRKGMGLGLSISRAIAEAHGGRLSARNNSGPGATFTLTLPTGPIAA